MKMMRRNLRPVYYCLYNGMNTDTDDDGYEYSEPVISYASAVSMLANISPATGSAQTEQFGNLDNYDKVLVTHDTECPVDENTVLFVDKEPEYTKDGRPLYDYTVRRVAKSLNTVAIAVRKVTVS